MLIDDIFFFDQIFVLHFFAGALDLGAASITKTSFDVFKLGDDNFVNFFHVGQHGFEPSDLLHDLGQFRPRFFGAQDRSNAANAFREWLGLAFR